MEFLDSMSIYGLQHHRYDSVLLFGLRGQDCWFEFSIAYLAPFSKSLLYQPSHPRGESLLELIDTDLRLGSLFWCVHGYKLVPMDKSRACNSCKSVLQHDSSDSFALPTCKTLNHSKDSPLFCDLQLGLHADRHTLHLFSNSHQRESNDKWGLYPPDIGGDNRTRCPFCSCL